MNLAAAVRELGDARARALVRGDGDGDAAVRAEQRVIKLDVPGDGGKAG